MRWLATCACPYQRHQLVARDVGRALHDVLPHIEHALLHGEKASMWRRQYKQYSYKKAIVEVAVSVKVYV